jgi:two-component system response regulator NreC
MRPPTQGSAIRTLLIDDDLLVAEGISAMLRRVSRFDVLWSPATARLDETVRGLRPDVVVMERALGRSGSIFEAIHTVRTIAAETAVVIFTRHSDDAWVQRLFDAGASAYVLKQSAAEQLVQAIEAAAAGQRYLDAALRERLARAFLEQHSPAGCSTRRLSDREHVVLRELAWGYGIKQIATRLAVSVKTVDHHRATGMHKLGLRDRRDLMQHALKERWLED